jgi:hypothetical protein
MLALHKPLVSQKCLSYEMTLSVTRRMASENMKMSVLLGAKDKKIDKKIKKKNNNIS